MFDGTYSFHCQHEITKRLKPKLRSFIQGKINIMKQNRNNDNDNDEYGAFILNLNENIRNKDILDIDDFIVAGQDESLVAQYLAQIEGDGHWLGMETINFMSEFFESSNPKVEFPTDGSHGKFAFYGLNRDTGGLLRQGSTTEPYALRNNHGAHWALYFKSSRFMDA